MTNLNAKVQAVNKVNEYAPQLYALLAAVFTPLIGEKVRKADGSFTKKVAALIPKLPYDQDGIRVTPSGHGNYISYTIYCRVELSPNCYASHDHTVYIATVEGDTLEKMYDPPKNLRTDFTAEEITKKRETLKAAQKLVSEVQSALNVFGEYDR